MRPLIFLLASSYLLSAKCPSNCYHRGNHRTNFFKPLKALLGAFLLAFCALILFLVLLRPQAPEPPRPEPVPLVPQPSPAPHVFRGSVSRSKTPLPPDKNKKPVKKFIPRGLVPKPGGAINILHPKWTLRDYLGHNEILLRVNYENANTIATLRVVLKQLFSESKRHGTSYSLNELLETKIEHLAARKHFYLFGLKPEQVLTKCYDSIYAWLYVFVCRDGRLAIDVFPLQLCVRFGNRERYHDVYMRGPFDQRGCRMAGPILVSPGACYDTDAECDTLRNAFNRFLIEPGTRPIGNPMIILLNPHITFRFHKTPKCKIRKAPPVYRVAWMISHLRYSFVKLTFFLRQY